MEGTIGQNTEKQREFALASISELSPSSPSDDSYFPVVARFSSDSGVTELRFHPESESVAVLNVDLQVSQVRFSNFFLNFVWLPIK